MSDFEINIGDLAALAEDPAMPDKMASGSCTELVELIEEIMSWEVNDATLQRATVLNVIKMYKENREKLSQPHGKLPFTQHQTNSLMKLYNLTQRPSQTQYEDVARETDLTLIQVKNWFTNRRKRQKNKAEPKE